MKNQNLSKTIRKGATSFIMIVALFALSRASLLAQNVGIGTTTPDPSAALHIDAKGKGVLFPSTYLDSETDDSNVPKPATNLFVFNTSNSLGSGAGLYYNAGTPALPNWTPTFGLKLPYFNSLNSPTVNFTVENYETFATSGAIRGFASASAGVQGESVVGTGVLAKNVSGLGNALEVDGKMKIAGAGQSPGLGKVLMSDASGNATWEGAVAFSVAGLVYETSIIPAATHQKIAFKDVEYDLGGNYKNMNGTPNNTFVVPTTGIYHFDVSVGWNATDDLGDDFQTYLKIIKKPYNFISSFDLFSEGGVISVLPVAVLQHQSISISHDFLLHKDDQISVSVYHNSDKPIVNLKTSEVHSRFSGRLIMKQ
ncbi:hypothetical protein [Dyadobacter arcticus]|uniref:C1q domain-containing protein n=1 Tax=Dyadobacter arcticus TaxID=1078754 RepID=A0ABX0UET0_9BACT|nr:hypothetical protein [Dyadobacter arcticus]NIJ51496.1 hypothetical protein [Dyadobacter arcticus]